MLDRVVIDVAAGVAVGALVSAVAAGVLAFLNVRRHRRSRKARHKSVLQSRVSHRLPWWSRRDADIPAAGADLEGDADEPREPTGDYRPSLSVGFPPSVGDRPTPNASDVPLPAKVQLVRVWFGTNRTLRDPSHPNKGFARERERDTVRYGSCDVAVPQSHKFGSTGSSFGERLIARTDDRMRLRRVVTCTEDEFWQAVQQAIGSAPDSERHALIYLHGYCCSFEDAAIRAAQIKLDLNAPLTAFFSWPSRGFTHSYLIDTATIEASEQAITNFLVRFATDVGAERVHIIAHSMGNRGLLRAMQRIEAAAERLSGIRFGQIFLAAADIDADLFRGVAHAYSSLSVRTTAYVSPADKAVALSRWLHGGSRLGFTPPVTVVDGVDTIEVPDFDLNMLSHAYYAQAAGVLHDMFNLIRHNDPPRLRQRLEPVDADGRVYWRMRR